MEDPCHDLRAKIIESLEDQKKAILKRAEEGEISLREAADRAPMGAPQQVATGELHTYWRDVLYPAYDYAREIDQQILDLLGMDCEHVRWKAYEMGISAGSGVSESTGPAQEGYGDPLSTGPSSDPTLPPRGIPTSSEQDTPRIRLRTGQPWDRDWEGPLVVVPELPQGEYDTGDDRSEIDLPPEVPDDEHVSEPDLPPAVPEEEVLTKVKVEPPGPTIEESPVPPREVPAETPAPRPFPSEPAAEPPVDAEPALSEALEVSTEDTPETQEQPVGQPEPQEGYSEEQIRQGLEAQRKARERSTDVGSPEDIQKQIADYQKQNTFQGESANMPRDKYYAGLQELEDKQYYRYVRDCMGQPDQRIKYGEGSYVELRPDGTVYTFEELTSKDGGSQVEQIWRYPNGTEVHQTQGQSQGPTTGAGQGGFEEMTISIREDAGTHHISSRATSRSGPAQQNPMAETELPGNPEFDRVKGEIIEQHPQSNPWSGK